MNASAGLNPPDDKTKDVWIARIDWKLDEDSQ